MSTESYRAFVLRGAGKLDLENRRLRELAPFEVALKVEAAGICGTDLAIISGQYSVPLPLVPGHEFVGTVAAVGSQVRRWRPGQSVVGEINNHCLALRREELCPACRKGLFKHCKVRTVLGIWEADGAFAEYVIVPAENLHPVGDSLSLEEAVLTEPVAAALETFEVCPVKPGEKILILGAGRLGCLIGAVARSRGCAVAAISRSEERRAFALQFGAHYAVPPSELERLSKSLTGGVGFDAAVEVSGDPNGLRGILPFVRPGGRIYVKSTSGLSAPLPLTELVVNEIQIYTSRCGDFRRALEFLSVERLPIQNWIKKFKFEQLGDALREAEKPGKVMIFRGN